MVSKNKYIFLTINHTITISLGTAEFRVIIRHENCSGGDLNTSPLTSLVWPVYAHGLDVDSGWIIITGVRG